MARERISPLFAVIALALCAALWTEIFLYSQNTLFANDRWIVSKRMAGVGIAEGDGLLLTRYALAGNVLHLGAWGGFQEVVSRFREPFDSAEFRFRHTGDTLSFTFNRTAQDSEGVLLRRGAGGSAFYRATPEGKILSWTPIQGLDLSPAWHKVRVEKRADGWSLAVDGQPVGNVSSRRPLSGPIAFRGDERGADVAEIRVEGPSGLWVENFRNTRHAFAAALSCLALLIALSAIRYRTFWDNLLDISAMGILGGAMWLPFDFFYLSHVPLQEQVLITFDIYGDEFARAGLVIPKEAHSPSELVRIRFFEAWNRLVGGEAVTTSALARRGYPVSRIWSGPIYCGPSTHDRCEQVDEPFMKALQSRPKPGLRVVYVGSSPMVGAGASTLDETPVAKIHRTLVKAFPGRPVESLNLSMSGELVHEVFDKYAARYSATRPDLMVICFGGTDDDWKPYVDGVERFLQINRAQGTRSAVIFEPMLDRITQNPRDTNPSSFSYRYARARELSSRYGASVLPLNEFLADPETQKLGFLWQAVAHQTPFAQELTSEWLGPKIVAELKGR